jgi:AAA domain
MFNTRVTAAADRTVANAAADFLAQPGVQRAVVIAAPAGAGKTRLVADVVGQARQRQWRVAVGAPTNEQAFGLVRAIATRHPSRTVTFVPANGVTLPEPTGRLPNVAVATPAAQAGGAGIIVGTLDKLGDAFNRGDLLPRDGLLVDEAFQADAARYYAVAGLAPTHLVVGDGGQLNPFSTMNGADRWRGLAEDPLQTAVGVLRRNHPATPVYQLPVTRRLDPRAVPVARAFYPGHVFDAAVLPGTRELRLLRGVARAPRGRAVDQALDLAARLGWAHLELPDAQVLTADPDTVELLVALATRLFARGPQVRCEQQPAWQPLAPRRVAVGVSHNDQKDLLRVALDAAGLDEVVVNTANKLQGLEFDVVLAWHPLAGLPEPDGFHLDPGRLAVLLTRHRHACVVVGRAGDRVLLEQLPPTTFAYLGWDPDPVLDGWDAHQQVFACLDAYRVAAA